RINISDAIISDLHRRIDETRFSDGFDDVTWAAGIPQSELKTLLGHWRQFDWRLAEKQLNAFPSYSTDIDGTGIHFLHIRGKGERRVPIILTNGWPSCFVEFLPLIPLLTEERNGWSFDVVIPSLPGYGFSDKPSVPGTNITHIASLWAELMRRLGYERFVAHGSDMGAGVVERLRANHGARVIGVHMVNVFSGYPTPSDPTAEEHAFLEAASQWRMLEGAYAMLHATKPHTIAAALNDSPAGLASWIAEKFQAWTDESKVSLDVICTILTIYWATQTIGSSQWLYREAFGDIGAMSPPPKQGAPVAVAIFPKDILPAPQAWGERWLDIRQWTVMERGGHFPSLEVPKLLADDIRAFVGQLC
ncbi:epoxide hydrolase, partial [Rhizobium sp. KVB221]